MRNIDVILNKANFTIKKKFILAVSGGVDSMVLLHYLVSKKYKPIIVHFNHHTRETNLRDEQLIINTAKEFNLKYYVKNISIKEGNFHKEARLERYRLLKSIAKENKTNKIMTAHHLDDLAETVLIKITRGSNLYGYAGIHPISSQDDYSYIRPLLHTSKDNIKSYAAKKHVQYFNDESNYSDTYLRNRYRHAVIPILKQENHNFLEKVLNYHKQLAGASDFIRKYCSRFIKDNKVLLKDILKEDKYIQENTLAILLELNHIEFNTNIINTLIDIINSDKANATYNLPNNFRFIKAYETVFVSNKSVIAFKKQVLKFGENKLSNMKLFTLLESRPNKGNDLIKICYNKLMFPLVLRTRNDGDKLAYDYGHKKLKDLLIDLKIPHHKRDELLVLTDKDDTILWVENVYFNDTLGSENKIYFKMGG